MTLATHRFYDVMGLTFLHSQTAINHNTYDCHASKLSHSEMSAHTEALSMLYLHIWYA